MECDSSTALNRRYGAAVTGGIEQVGPQHRIAALGDAPLIVDLTRGVTPCRQPDIGADVARACEPGRIVDRRSVGGIPAAAVHPIPVTESA